MCYMTEGTGRPMRVGVRELRQNLSVYLERVKEGETMEVTEHGHPVAHLTPLPVEPASALERLVAEGRATPAYGDLLELETVAPPARGPSVSEVLRRMREDERW
jgi:prevent-host-death family protein